MTNKIIRYEFKGNTYTSIEDIIKYLYNIHEVEMFKFECPKCNQVSFNTYDEDECNHCGYNMVNYAFGII